MLVKIGDTQLFVETDGMSAEWGPSGPRARPTLIMIHGGPGGDHREYPEFLGALRDVAQLVYVDLRAHGQSDDSPPESWNLATWARDIRDLCVALGIERPIVLGTSFGSFVALRYAVDHPDHLAGLVLLAASGRHDVDRIVEAFGRFGGPEHQHVARRFFTDPTEESQAEYRRVCHPLYRLTPGPVSVTAPRSAGRPEISRHFFGGEANRYDLLEAVGGLRCPVLIANGASDPVTPFSAAEELFAAFPDGVARLHRIENASHDLAADAPVAVRELVRRFVCNEIPVASTEMK